MTEKKFISLAVPDVRKEEDFEEICLSLTINNSCVMGSTQGIYSNMLEYRN